MFIESPELLWVGAGFSAQLSLDRPVKLHCSVKRVEPGLGMGVTITAAEETNQQRYQDFINALSALPPEL